MVKQKCYTWKTEIKKNVTQCEKLISRLNLAEKRISGIKSRPVEIAQSEIQMEKIIFVKEIWAFKTSGTISDDSTPMWLES